MSVRDLGKIYGDIPIFNGEGANSIKLNDGDTSYVYGDHSVSMGVGNSVTGSYCLATGDRNTAEGTQGFVGGFMSTSKNNYSFAFGRDCEAGASGSIAMGRLCKTTDSGSIAMGQQCTPTGQFSTTIGAVLTAKGKGAFTCGIANDSANDDECIFQVGTGSSSTNKRTGMALTHDNKLRLFSPNKQHFVDIYIDDNGTVHGAGGSGNNTGKKTFLGDGTTARSFTFDVDIKAFKVCSTITSSGGTQVMSQTPWCYVDIENSYTLTETFNNPTTFTYDKDSKTLTLNNTNATYMPNTAGRNYIIYYLY